MPNTSDAIRRLVDLALSSKTNDKTNHPKKK